MQISDEIQAILDPKQRTEWVGKPELAIKWQHQQLLALYKAMAVELIPEDDETPAGQFGKDAYRGELISVGYNKALREIRQKLKDQLGETNANSI